MYPLTLCAAALVIYVHSYRRNLQNSEGGCRMFEYVTEKKVDKEEFKGKVITVVLTLAFATGLFTVLYYWVNSGV